MSKLISKLLCIGALIFSGLCSASALPTLKATFLMEHEGFLLWYAKQQGWDEKLGFNLDLTILKSNGIEILKEYRRDPYSMDITCMSSIPFIMGTKDIDLDVISIANDESPTTSVLVRNDSDILNVTGYDQFFPDIYGSPETVKDKTFAVKGVSSGAYTLAQWLEHFHLDFNNIKLVSINDTNIVKSITENKYDGAALWSPDVLDAQKNGYKIVATAQQMNEIIPCMIMATQDAVQDKPELVAKALAIYLKAVSLQIKDPKALVSEYKRFYDTIGDSKVTEEFCLDDLKGHIVFPLEEQLKMFSTEGNRRSHIQKMEKEITGKTLLILRTMESKDIQVSHRISSQKYINNRFIQMAEKYYNEL